MLVDDSRNSTRKVMPSADPIQNGKPGRDDFGPQSSILPRNTKP
jgi:hypothetical protein